MTGIKRAGAADMALGDLISVDADIVGVASLAEWKGTKLEQTALALLPEARSVVVVGREIMREVLDLARPSRVQGAASTTDLMNTDANFLYGRLTKDAYDIAWALHSHGLRALPLPGTNCPTDNRFMEAVFSYKHAGQAAGLGKIGWHSLLITPDRGPRVRLAACITEAVLEPTAGLSPSFDCDSCRACLQVCPAGALSEPPSGQPYSINKFACSAFRVAAGGCSECMRVCPPGKRSKA